MSSLLRAFSRLRAQNLFTVIFLTISLCFAFPTLTWAESSGLGVNNGALAPCPATNNCVVSQNADVIHTIEPIVYHGDRNTAWETLLKVLTVVPRTQVIEKTDNYIHALSKSRIFKFVDDVEFYLPTDEAVIHIRSASRIGEWDLGVNRRRIEQIRLALQELNI
ncbi:hypothetical protein B6N60_01549 [Richelia sinica FACHB-800]|uniref:DUF1499 domain-containing protein n=1 Tax=Richelia sinica FACHB-800 TaxID=1357546 RepID=A0A975T618_9NOST|nr:DUF1499 domain-containing protein [Richelia sinica]MBD2663582.1 DUF1499 domain-containing protein [Richelia sinica FACHB-800]QXE22863.1 hypothetical protein B6N60_01549 [Richelia sinica FACHB-800]